MDVERLRVVFGWVVLGAWIASLLIAIVDRSYSPEPTVHILMMVVAGALFGPSFVRKDK